MIYPDGGALNNGILRHRLEYEDQRTQNKLRCAYRLCPRHARSAPLDQGQQHSAVHQGLRPLSRVRLGHPSVLFTEMKSSRTAIGRAHALPFGDFAGARCPHVIA